MTADRDPVATGMGTLLALSPAFGAEIMVGIQHARRRASDRTRLILVVAVLAVPDVILALNLVFLSCKRFDLSITDV